MSAFGVIADITRNAAGTLSGKVDGAGFQVMAKRPIFTANLNLVTRGGKHGHDQVARRTGRRAGCDNHSAA